VGNVTEASSTAEILQDNLTERGLVRELARQDISPQLVHVLPIEEAARLLQRQEAHPSKGRKSGKKAKKVKMAKKAKAKKAMTKKTAHKALRLSPPRMVQPNYWKRVKKELHVLICTNDKRYASLRRQLDKSGSSTQTAIVSNVAAAIAVNLGYTVAALVPFVVMALIAFLRLGANAWCAGQA
jgi:hypothetical protein